MRLVRITEVNSSAETKNGGHEVAENRRRDKEREAQDAAQEVRDSNNEKPRRSYTHRGR